MFQNLKTQLLTFDIFIDKVFITVKPQCKNTYFDLYSLYFDTLKGYLFDLLQFIFIWICKQCTCNIIINFTEFVLFPKLLSTILY